MKDSQIAHLKGWGPIYAVLAVIGGGGGAAAITDSIPVTNGQFLAWTTEHAAAGHPQSNEAIKVISEGLAAIRTEQTRQQLATAYADKCMASDDALDYIEREITRLEAIYFELTTREYDPRPCPA